MKSSEPIINLQNKLRTFDNILELSDTKFKSIESKLIIDFIKNFASSLTTLKISNCTFPEDFSRPFSYAISSCHSLTLCDFNNTDFSKQNTLLIFEELSQLKSLKYIYLKNCIKNSTNFARLILNPANFEELKILNISSNNINANMATSFSELFCHLYCLEKIDFSENPLGTLGIEHLSDKISNLKKLQQINASRIMMNNSGLLIFFRNIHRICTLEKILLNGNEIEGPLPSEFLSIFVEFHKLNSFGISDNKLNQIGLEQIVKLLSNNQIIKRIDFSFNGIKEEESSNIIELLNSCEWNNLQEIYWDGLFVSNASLLKMKDSLTKFKKMKDI